MSQTVVHLGQVPINRGTYTPEAKYYKDNIVQYNGSAFIARPTAENAAGNSGTESDPIYYITVVPYDVDPTQCNPGWEVFASDSAYCASIFTYEENPEFCYVMVDSEQKILFGVHWDGEFIFGTGCPSQIKDYVNAKVAEAQPENYEQVLAFLGDLINSDTTLQMLLDSKANVSDVNEALATKADQSEVDKINNHLHHLNLAIDPDRGVLRIGNKMFKLIDYTGPADFDEDIDYTIFIEATTTLENPEWQQAITDSEDRLLYGKKQGSGEEYWPQQELEGYTMTVDGVTASVNSIIRNIK